MQEADMVPVTILTGFLGSGKTTLIQKVLQDPRFARTAVIVNEFGEIGLDHDVLASSSDTLIRLSTGCLCCAVRSDLIETLLDLHRRRADGEVDFERIIIETSGLADPVPILQSLMTDKAVATLFNLDGVLTLVDAVHGPATVAKHVEARRQVAVADRILVTKTDVTAPSAALLDDLRALNPALIVVSITPFGQSGPYAEFEASDLEIMALSGAMSLAGEEDGEPMVFRCPSYPSRKNSLSLRTGPPMTPPKSSIAVGCLGLPARMKGFLASKASSRPKA